MAGTIAEARLQSLPSEPDAPARAGRALDPPALLLDPDAYGTLAAVRCLGRAGVSVVVAGATRFAPAAQSRFVQRFLEAPQSDDPERLLEWLLAFGRAHPGHVLYPTSDNVAWLIAAHRDALRPHFRLHTPALDVLARVLDKRALEEAAAAASVRTPATRFPSSAAEAVAMGGELGFPLLLKPRTQVWLSSRAKGMLVADAAAMPEAYGRYMQHNRYHPALAAELPGVEHPMLQTFLPEAAEGILSVAGFAGADGTIQAVAARKRLQRPRRLGIGLCFEAVPLEPAVREAVQRLCGVLGYYGVFEAEFVDSGGSLLIIDFNPRYYSQMQFEIARGLPLPLLAYRAALGADAPAQVADGLIGDLSPAARGYTHGFYLALVLGGQRVTRRMTAAEANGWRTWRRGFTRGALADAVFAGDDRRPAFFDWAQICLRMVAHPRSSARGLFLER